MLVIFTSYNPGKLKEVKNLGLNQGLDIISLAETGVELQFEETGLTFEDNAKLKLKQALEATQGKLSDWIAAERFRHDD